MIARRIFLKQGALTLLSLGLAPRFLARTAAASEGRRRVLVALFQRGAVDGLNMVVPFGDRDYARARPSIAIAAPRRGDEETALDLDGLFGLHPRLAPLKPLYDRGALAIVHACGSPNPTRSHFDAQDYLETATPGLKSTSDGWLNRCLQARPDPSRSPFRAVALTSRLPRSLQGSAPALAIDRLDRFGVRAQGGDSSAALFEAAYAAAADPRLRAAGREAFDAVRLLRRAAASRGRDSGPVDYPRSNVGAALREVAALIKADVGLEIAFAESGGWDHHVNEGGANGQLAARLDDLARSLAAFVADLGDRFEDVVIVTMTEFGRTVAENGSGGTDHGHGAAMFVLGGRVRGGRVFGRWPGLAPEVRFEGRDLAVTTDFRDLFAEIAVHHLGVRDPGPIFPGFQVAPERFPGVLAS